MVPDSEQSADTEAKGLHLTQAGPDLIEKFAYLDAEIARYYAPQSPPSTTTRSSAKANIISRKRPIRLLLGMLSYCQPIDGLCYMRRWRACA
jgi:hypothetical protein